MKYVILFALLMIGNVIYAEPQYCSFGKYSNGQKVHLFGDNVNIRNRPNTTGRIVARLRIGTELTIIKNTGQSLTLGKYRENWYQVSFLNKGRRRRGFVWGGLIAKAVFHPWAGRFLAVVGIHANSDGTKAGKVRLVSKRKRILHEIKIKPIVMNEGKTFNYSMFAAPLKVQGFSSNIRLYRINFEYGACDYPFGNIVVGVSKKRLIKGFEAAGAVNEIGGVNFKYITGKRRNVIRVLFTSSMHGQEGKPAKIQEIRYEDYYWNGRTIRRIAKGKLPIK